MWRGLFVVWLADLVFYMLVCFINDHVELFCYSGNLQQCYSQPNCVAGSEIALTPTSKDCCTGTNDGQSYADSSGNCVVSQCVGKRFTNYWGQ